MLRGIWQATATTVAMIVGSALPAAAATEPVKHFPPEGVLVSGAVTSAGPAFSGAVMAGNTLYVSGVTDSDPQTGAISPEAKTAATIVLKKVQRTIERAGLTMDNLVWVQVFAADLQEYAAFNEVYRTFFKGELPARAFLGTASLLGKAHYEVMGIAVKPQ
jgi:2-iminobutanoate/2-iminopropanoate deaminase